MTGRHWSVTVGAMCVIALLACHRPRDRAIVRASDPACTAASNDTSVRRLLRTLDAVAHAPPAWADYSVGRHPLLLWLRGAGGAERGRACLAFWRQRSALTVISVDSAPPLATPLYGLIDTDPIGPRATPEALASLARQQDVSTELRRVLATHRATRVVVLPQPLRFDDLGAFGKVMQQQGADPVMLQLYLAVHEGFHLHSQVPTWLDQPRRYAWPAWDHQPARRQLVASCYAGGDSIAQLVRREQGELRMAWTKLMPDAGGSVDRDGAREHARRFVATRETRYRALRDVRIAQDTAHVSCAVGEAIMELEEGAPQWIAHTAIVRAGVQTVQQMRRAYVQPQTDMFYQLGAMQLWILEGWRGPAEMRSLTARLGAAPRPDEAIFGEFRAVFASPGDR